MKRKIISTLFALVLVAGFSLMPAVPVAAVTPVYAQGHAFREGGDGTAEWSTVQFSAGSYSVKLDVPGGVPDYGAVNLYLTTPVALSALSGDPTFQANGVEINLEPYLNILLDTDLDGVYDDALEGVKATPSDGYEAGWHEMAGGGYYDADNSLGTGGGYIDSLNTANLAYWQANAPTPTVVGFQIMVGNLGHTIPAQTVYIDDITIDTTPYAMEPRVINTTQVKGYNTIQAAINDEGIGTGDTITVAAGTYEENLVVDVEGLTIEAASSPVIDGGGNLGPGVHITAADVTFQGFTITNFTCTPTSGIGAILVEGDGAVIDDNTIYAITPTDGPAGIGIDVHASNVEVTNNIVHDVGSIGIRVRHDWDTAPTVSNNVLLEKNKVYRTANTGVLVTGYAKGVTIRENEIYESLEPTPYSLFVHYGAEDVLIEDNIIRDPYNSAVGNNVVLAGCDNVTISGNTITGATSGKNINILSDYWPEEWVDAELLSTHVTIINNDILNGKWGVRIEKTVAIGDAFQMAATTTINFNNISGNTEYGVENTIETPVNAECNWWGDIAGPYTDYKMPLHNPYDDWTNGDAVSSDVDYIPWLIQSELAEDWNIWSRPIAPDEDSWEQMQAELVEDGIDSIYYYDSATQLWGAPDDAGPLDAFYIKMPAESRVRYCISDNATFPGQKAMKVGWNLVGLADLHPGMGLVDALSDAEWGTGQTNLVGYNKVISPSLNGVYWTYVRDGSPHPLFTTKGYWVLMVNDGVLGGFTETPIVEVAGPLPPP